jgi:hypothetical protein
VKPLKNRTEGEQLAAYTKILQQVATGTPLKMHWMDNEALTALKPYAPRSFNQHISLYLHTFTVKMQLNK